MNATTQKTRKRQDLPSGLFWRVTTAGAREPGLDRPDHGLADFEKTTGLAIEAEHWRWLHGKLTAGVAYWLYTMPAEQRARMAPELVHGFGNLARGEMYDPGDRVLMVMAGPVPLDTARLKLRDILNELLFSPVMEGTQALGADLRYAPQPRTVIQALIVQFYEAVRDDKTFRVCEHCDIPYEYSSERSRFCSDSCKTLAWRARKQQAATAKPRRVKK